MLYRCPRCSSPMRRRNSRYGPFLGCVRFPACRGSCDLPPDDPLAEVEGRPNWMGPQWDGPESDEQAAAREFEALEETRRQMRDSQPPQAVPVEPTRKRADAPKTVRMPPADAPPEQEEPGQEAWREPPTRAEPERRPWLLYLLVLAGLALVVFYVCGARP